MSEVTQTEARNHREIVNAYDELTMQFCHIESIAHLITAVDTEKIGDGEVNEVGYTIEHMMKEAREKASRLFDIADAK